MWWSRRHCSFMLQKCKLCSHDLIPELPRLIQLLNTTPLCAVCFEGPQLIHTTVKNNLLTWKVGCFPLHKTIESGNQIEDLTQDDDCSNSCKTWQSRLNSKRFGITRAFIKFLESYDDGRKFLTNCFNAALVGEPACATGL